MKIDNYYRIRRYIHILYIKNIFFIRNNINRIKMNENLIYSKYVLNKIKQNKIKQ